MSIEQEALKALSDGQLAKSLVQSISWVWLIVAMGIPMAGLIVYKYLIQSITDRIILFLSNEPWTDAGKLVEMHGEKWVIKKLGILRVYLWKAELTENRGKEEYMKKTLTIAIPKYLSSDIIYYEYSDLYSEKNLKNATFEQIEELFDRIKKLEESSK